MARLQHSFGKFGYFKCRCCRKIFCGCFEDGDSLELPPTQDSSHHQDDIPFLVGNPYKPSFVTVTGRGDNPNYR